MAGPLRVSRRAAQIIRTVCRPLRDSAVSDQQHDLLDRIESVSSGNYRLWRTDYTPDILDGEVTVVGSAAYDADEIAFNAATTSANASTR